MLPYCRVDNWEFGLNPEQPSLLCLTQLLFQCVISQITPVLHCGIAVLDEEERSRFYLLQLCSDFSDRLCLACACFYAAAAVIKSVVLFPSDGESIFYCTEGGGFVKSDMKREYSIGLLVKKHDELGRLPKRSDFPPETVCLIKQKLGPWPRALEAAGLKEASRTSSAEKSREKRECSRRRRKSEM